MIVDCVSDLHGYYPKLEGGDLLIVAGDWTKADTFDQLHYFEKEWLRHQEYKKIILVAGNHDNLAQECGWVGQGKIEYLCDSGTEFNYEYYEPCNFCGEGNKCSQSFICPPPTKKTLKIWGSPWTKTFVGMNPQCKAFTLNTDKELAKKWELIPDGIDILVTHSPPLYSLDGVPDMVTEEVRHYGSEALGDVVWRLNPRLHVFGHIHEGHGILDDDRQFYRRGKFIRHPIFINASHVNEHYKPVNKPVRIIL